MANDNKLVNLADLKAAFDEVNDKAGVVSVNGQTGAVSITPASIGAKAVQTAVSSPAASGTTLAFIDSISQNAQGVITPTKKTVAAASQSVSGLMSATDKTKLDGIAAGAQVNSLTGVKGNAESSYRTGNVNLTPANIGAHPAKSNLQVTNNSNYTGTTESSAPIAQILDSSGYIRHQLYGSYASDGRSLTFLSVRRPNGTSNEANQISVGFDKDGNKIYSVSDSAAFRSAIGATPAGIGLGTVTNALTAKSNYGGASQVFGFEFTVDNSSNSKLNGHKMILLVRNDDIQLYDETTQSIKYSLNPYNTRVKGNAESSYRTGDVNITPANIGAATSINLGSTDTTPSTIYNKIKVLSSEKRDGALIHIHQAALNVLTNRTDFDFTYSGLVTIIAADTYRFLLARGSSTMICFYANITSSAITPGNIYQYNGTLMS